MGQPKRGLDARTGGHRSDVDAQDPVGRAVSTDGWGDAPHLRALDPDALVERDGPLDVLRDAVSSVSRGRGCLVVIEGAPGTGRSTLLEITRRMGADAALLVLNAHGTPLESDVSHGLALQLLEPELRAAGRRDRGRLLAGDTSAIARAFDERRWPTEAEPGTEPALDELFVVVRSLASQRPVLITVDDAQWADEVSLRLLLYLVQRLEGLAVGVVVTVPTRRRGGNGPLLEQLAQARSVRCVQLAPLSDAGATELVRRLLPTASDHALPPFMRATRGNPLLLTKLAESVRASRAPCTEGGLRQLVSSAPVPLLRAALMRLEHLAKPCVALTRAVAVLGEPAALRAAAAVAGLDARAAATAATALVMAGMLDDAELLRFAQPLLGWITYADIPAAARARMHGHAARLRAEAGAPAAEVASHALQSWPGGDGWIVEQLVIAAAEATSQAQPERAIGLLRRALAEPPPAERHAEVLVALGVAEAATGAEDAPQRLLEGAKLMADPAERARTRWRAGGMLAQRGHHACALGVLESAIADFDCGGAACPGDLESDYLTSALLVPAGARDAHRRLRLTRAAAARSPLLRLERVLAGEPVEPIAPATTPGALDAASLSCLLWSDELAAIERACAAAIRACDGVAGPTMVHALITRASARLRGGDLAAATRDAAAALDGAGTGRRAAAAACLAHCHIERDDLEGAAAALLATGGPDVFGDQALAASRLDIEQGQAARALHRLLETGRDLQPVTANPAVLAWRSLAAGAALALGERGRARELAGEEVQLARRFGAPRPLGVALRAAGQATAGARGIALLEESVATLARSPAQLELGHSHIALGAALRHAGRLREAREALRAGAEVAERCGALRLQRLARDELTLAGARPRRRDVTGLASFTPGERRVAELVAAGLSNRAIAEELVVTPKAVQWHLRHLYRKLDVVGRDQLVERLRVLRTTVDPGPLGDLGREGCAAG